MKLEDLIYSRLEECHVVFPTYNERTTKSLDIIARIFTRELAGWTDDEVNAAFDEVLKGDKFPVLKNVLDFKKTMTAYRMDNGPDGYGALYGYDHPYVQRQIRLGTDIGMYAETVMGEEARKLDLMAMNAPPLLDYDGD